MTYYLPPPDDASGLHAVSGVRGAPGATADRGPPGPGLPDGRILRTVKMPAAELAAYLGAWESDPPPAAVIPAPAGVIARERQRPDRSMPGTVRRQRLAMVAEGLEATALHWSAPEPVTADDESAWQRALGRLAAAGAAGGWRA